MSNETSQLLWCLADELRALGPKLVQDLVLEANAVTAFAKGLRLSAFAVNEPGAHPALAHVHVVATLGHGPVATLDACVVGIGDERPRALADAVKTWVALAGAPILSLVHGGPVLDAVHFSGSEPWGVEGRHGFVGPLNGRFGPGFDLDALGAAPLFAGAARLAPDDGLHLVKVTLCAVDGRWRRTLELDGHGESSIEDDFAAGTVAPASAGVASCFAVFFAGQ